MVTTACFKFSCKSDEISGVQSHSKTSQQLYQTKASLSY